MIVPVPISLAQFTAFLLDRSVHLHPVQTLALCTNGSRVGFAVSHEPLETENQKGVLGSLAAKSL